MGGGAAAGGFEHVFVGFATAYEVEKGGAHKK